MYIVILVFFFVDLFPGCSMHYWKCSIEVSDDHCWIIYLYPQFCQPLLHIFQGSVVQCIYVYNCYNFLMDWHSYHYEMSLFVSSKKNIKAIFSDISITIPSFLWLLYAWYISFHPFTSNLLYLWIEHVFLRANI